ncbi:hypothetical protein AWQ21_15620 (plasmid) [Picosynechococcus sp. PCC 7003]|uniref:serine hydrolase n=1 Tax=Picosynechococcus sp. PCC 7003 TaxID=374981 RepID=UPI0008105816|nr:serine hydrolase [Picosynechococcus sp. PCC 7003]ANV85950.1 hypothetical protein AWQ21_15620 [Picosynechococcus sp. PCC 7003]
MSPQQFVALVGGMAIAIVVGGVWLIRASLGPTQQTTESTETVETGSQEELPVPAPPDSAGNEVAAVPETLLVQPIWRAWYNAQDPLRNYAPSAQLQGIITEIQGLAQAENLPPEAMSMVLVDLNRQAIASYRPDTFHYPASVPKLFWLVAFYAQVEQGLLNYAGYAEDVALMVEQSDNNATSRIIDAMTRTTQTQTSATPDNFGAWYTQRGQLNGFFQAAGYAGLNITQKTYPITDVEIMEPIGFDLKMRENPEDATKPIRNRLSAYQAARLMAEIAVGEGISPTDNSEILQLLARDLSQDWQSPKTYFNPVQHFFGEGLPPDTKLYSKAGWTSQGRHEVAYIESADGQQKYVLSVFADHPAYSENETFFPAIAQLVHSKIKSPAGAAPQTEAQSWVNPTN